MIQWRQAVTRKNEVVFRTSYIQVRRTPKGWCISFQCYVYPAGLGPTQTKGFDFWLDKLKRHFELAWAWIEEDAEERRDD
jgi:hypothetical protein